MSWFNTTTGTTTVPTTNTWPQTVTTGTTTTGLGQDYAKILGQLQGNQYQVPYSVPTPVVKLPIREDIQPRIAMLEKQLELLKEVDALLEKHPDLERLVGTLHRLGSL